jgi:alkanesulfonate monooxygenase
LPATFIAAADEPPKYSGIGLAVFAGLLGAQGNSTALVGTAEQVAEALLDYYELGISTFLIRGFDPLEDAIDYGRQLIPLTRQLIAQRAARVA